MVPPDPFSDNLHHTIREPLLALVLGNVEGGYAELVGQDLPGGLPIIKFCVKRAVEYPRKERPGDPVRPGTGLNGIEGRMNAFARPKQ